GCHWSSCLSEHLTMRDLAGWSGRWREPGIKAWQRLTISNGARVLKSRFSTLATRHDGCEENRNPYSACGPPPATTGEARSEAIEPSRWLHSAKAGIIEGWLAKIRLPPPG